MNIRKANDRGRAKFDWLDSKHSFSFGSYYDPKFMGFGPLRVINEDRVIPGGGFATHPHQDMEIISYVIEGGLEHKDSLGTGSVIVPGEVQRMSAGTGITHSEYNPSKTDSMHFLQIWIIPNKKGLPPSYEQKQFFANASENEFILVASPDQREGSLLLHQDVNMYAAKIHNKDLSVPIKTDRLVWVQVVKGSLILNGSKIEAGDGVALEHISELSFTDAQQAEFLLFDMTSL